MSLAVLLAAIGMDSIIGYPDGLYRRVGHPVGWAARMIRAMTALIDRSELQGAGRRLGGVVLMVVLVLVSGGSGWALSWLSRLAPGLWMVEAMAVASLLAGRSLVVHVRGVAGALQAGGVVAGRKAVAQIVGRDVSALDRAGVARAALESLAENASDGWTGPVLAYLAAGLPGLAIYKAVSTADSLIGYRSEPYRDLGWAAARLDDLLNLIPARLTAVLLALAAGRRCGTAMATARRDAHHHLSPNAGWPEAAMAGALGLRLGGPRSYGSEQLAGAWFGDGRPDADVTDIERGLTLATRAWALAVAVIAAAALFSLSPPWAGPTP